MPRRGYSTIVGKFAKFYQEQRRSEIRMLGELLRREQRAACGERPPSHEARRRRITHR